MKLLTVENLGPDFKLDANAKTIDVNIKVGKGLKLSHNDNGITINAVPMNKMSEWRVVYDGKFNSWTDKLEFNESILNKDFIVGFTLSSNDIANVDGSYLRTNNVLSAVPQDEEYPPVYFWKVSRFNNETLEIRLVDNATGLNIHYIPSGAYIRKIWVRDKV